jgi:hypothetical protein
MALENASEWLQDNEVVVMAAVQETSRALEFASDRLKDNDTIVTAAVQCHVTRVT